MGHGDRERKDSGTEPSAKVQRVSGEDVPVDASLTALPPELVFPSSCSPGAGSSGGQSAAAVARSLPSQSDFDSMFGAALKSSQLESRIIGAASSLCKDISARTYAALDARLGGVETGLTTLTTEQGRLAV